ncbi:MAG TPA: A/G-specific adenine glycosylase [Alphaproteobacteria bacterium]|nr:A/G-specific adenine glycosylase [Alphaproteobacteria bacterium]HBA42968.1 A/G-specific adenine glycosylase [Alphaproteobacteria bacterium]
MPDTRRLLDWYDAHRRDLPWRARAGSRPDPYRVWLSEIMLQQTTVATVSDYFDKFIDRWPDVHALAAAPLEAVLTEWAGLGYYARARNLHQCAQIVSAELGGQFPANPQALQTLPGIGPYTAAAVAAIAFDMAAPVLDGNIERVSARLFAVTEPLPGARKTLRPLAGQLIDNGRPGDTAQALMDLGAAICTPRAPRCGDCPLSEGCAAHRQSIAESLPRKPARKQTPTRRAATFWLERPRDGAVYFETRPAKGLLGGMLGLPCSPWESSSRNGKPPPTARAAARHAPARGPWQAVPGEVTHIFTHFRLQLTVYQCRTDTGLPDGGQWIVPADFPRHPLPTLMRKIAAHVLTPEVDPQ